MTCEMWWFINDAHFGFILMLEVGYVWRMVTVTAVNTSSDAETTCVTL